MKHLCRLALLAGTLDGCVQLLSARGDEAARTHKSSEWYWLDATISAEYCSTYRDVMTDNAERSHKKAPAESASRDSEPAPNAVQTGVSTQIAESGSSKATVSNIQYPFFYDEI
jgi:hypothetical protein